MTIQDPPRFWLGLLLSLVAGWIAAVAFLEFGGLSVAFMSGNTVQLGLAGAQRDAELWIRPVAAIAGFLIGSAIGSALSVKTPGWTAVLTLGLEALALAGAALLFHLSPGPGIAIVWLVAFAMGVQNHVVAKGRPDSAGTTYITGTVFKLGDAIGRGLAGGENPVPWLLFLAVCVACAVGAALGVGSVIHVADAVFAVPALLIAVLAAISAASPRLRGVS